MNQRSLARSEVRAALRHAGIALARTAESAKSYLVVSGVLYVVLFLYGLFVGRATTPTSAR